MIYLDHNATSPLLPEVLDAVRPWLGVPANPASVHRAGQAAAAAVDRARAQVAALVGGDPAGVVFTSGATEANHTFVRATGEGRRVVVSPVEHPCVHGAAASLRDAAVERLEVGADGVVVVPALDEDVGLVSLMAANHETGVLQPIDDALARCAEVGARLHVDATQAAGRVPLSLGGVDGVVLSSHKLGGPPGVGALVLPDGEPFPALLTGGSQERGRRAGTVPTALVVGFGAACDLAIREMDDRNARWRDLSARIAAAVRAAGGVVVGEGSPRIANTTCAVFPGLRGESLVQAFDLRGICVSSGAACASGSVEASPVLRAMGIDGAVGALRVSLGPRTTADEVDAFCAALPEVVEALQTIEDWG